MAMYGTTALKTGPNGIPTPVFEGSGFTPAAMYRCHYAAGSSSSVYQVPYVMPTVTATMLVCGGFTDAASSPLVKTYMASSDPLNFEVSATLKASYFSSTLLVSDLAASP